MDLIFHPAAARDAREIVAKYAAVSDKLADEFWDELDASIEAIAEFPERHHYDPCGLRRFNLKRFPFHVLFEQHMDLIRVMVVRHHHRNPSYGLRRR